MGSSLAYFLAKRRVFNRIMLIEKDFNYSKCSTTRSAGGIRHQFSTAQNIKFSQFSYDFLSNINEHLKINNDIDISFKKNGYLFLASEKGVPVLLGNHNLQKSIIGDGKMTILNREELEKKFPFINCDGINMASFGNSYEGWIDPHSLLVAFTKKATELGVELVKDEVINMYVNSLTNNIHKIDLSSSGIDCSNNTIVVNCAGAYSNNIMKMIGKEVPVRAKKRYVFVVESRDEILRRHQPSCPLVIDTSGVYFRPEGSYFIVGKSPSEDSDPDYLLENMTPEELQHEFNVVDHSFFDNEIWPDLAERIPGFQSIKVVNSWSGFYEFNTFDHNAIIGKHDEIRNLFLCHGFSGHGLMHSPAAGYSLSGLIVDDTVSSLYLWIRFLY
eukprot:TRINITY_DN4400_c0_g1_i2.p1 TRINITY_DN4400_c0_g1~~TRINITY_DN4400_c0_g1_i2.p1  ORF type:complete len:435 (-),score=29.04 TRINITY_DN4400_c0_g1_i2:171-1328(-)